MAATSPSGPMCSEVLRSFSSPVDALGDRARDEVDAQLARGVARPRHRRAVERLGAGLQVLAVPEDAPLLRQHDEARAVGRGAAHEAVGRLEVASLVRSRRQLHGGGTKYWRLISPSPARLTDESIAESIARMLDALPYRGDGTSPPRGARAAPRADAAPHRSPAAQALALRGRLRARADAVRGHGPRRRAPADLLGGLGPRGPAPLGAHRPAPRPGRAARRRRSRRRPRGLRRSRPRAGRRARSRSSAATAPPTSGRASRRSGPPGSSRWRAARSRSTRAA